MLRHARGNYSFLPVAGVKVPGIGSGIRLMVTEMLEAESVGVER